MLIRCQQARWPATVASIVIYSGQLDPSKGPSERDPLDLSIHQCVTYTLMTSKDLIRELHDAEWTLDRVAGSHHVFKHPTRPGHVTVPHPKKDLGIGLVKAIRRQAGI